MNQPHVDRYGLIRVPVLQGQTPMLWEGLGFRFDRDRGECFRSVDQPYNEKLYRPEQWLKSADNKFELFGGIVRGRSCSDRIAPRETDPQALADYYWMMQDRWCWSAHHAFEEGWAWRLWAANLIKRFGITDRRVISRIRREAERQWAAWEQLLKTGEYFELAASPVG